MAEGRDPKPEEMAVINRWERELLRGRDAVSLVLARASILSKVDDLRKNKGVAEYLPAIFSSEEKAEIEKQIERWNKIEKLFHNGKAGIVATQIENNDITLYLWPGHSGEGLTGEDQGPIGFGWVVPLMVIGKVLIAGCVVATTALITWYLAKDKDLKSRQLEIDRLMALGPADVRQAYQDLRDSEAYRKDQGFLDSLLSKGSSLFGVLMAVVMVALMIDVGKLWRGKRAPRENPFPPPCSVTRNPSMPGYVSPPSKGGWKGRVYWSHDPKKRKRQAQHIQDWIDRATTAAYIEYYQPGKSTPVVLSEDVPF